ncbi:MAG: DUF2961 domain-containing protein [Phycisphaerae bacterium]|jgi:hypothetical protein
MKRHVGLWCAAPVLAVLAQAATAAVTIDSLLDEMVDLKRLAQLPDPAYVTKQFSSYDPASKTFSDYQGWYANGDAGQFLRRENKDGRTEFVMMDINGPGAIVRIWSANPAGVLRIYLDGNAAPAIEAPMNQLLGGQFANLTRPIAGEYSRGWNLYFPIPYARHCKVTSDQGRFYYHVNYRTYAEGTAVKTFEPGDLQRLSSKIEETARRLDSPREGAAPPADRKKTPFQADLAPGAEAVLAELNGSLAICGLLTHLAAEDLAAAARGVVLKIAFDGEQTVEAPIGDFYGTAPGLTPYASLPLGITEPAEGKPQDLWCHWYMPFSKTARVAVKNFTDKNVKIDGAVATVPYEWNDRSLLFHAKWRIERNVPSRPFSDWQHLMANGAGRFVGGHLHIINNVKDWWGEGDEKIYVDGETFPSHFGTGTEDYYGYAWCSPERFVHAYHNQPRCDGPGNYGNTSVNRWHIVDDIPFTRCFRFDIENWQWNLQGRNTRAAISYWYARPKSTDFFGPIIASDVRYDPVPEYPVFRVKGAIEGEQMRVLSKTGGKTEVQKGVAEWSEDGQLWWTQAKPGDKLELALRATEAGRKRVVARFTKAVDYGIVQLYVNGKKAGEPIDFYNNGVIPSPEIDLGEFDLQQGRNVLTVEITGTNPNSKGDRHMFGLDYVLLK